MRTSGLYVLLAVIATSPLAAQWKITDPDLPRLPNGQPNLTAPAPRRPDGKPDLTGIWDPSPPKVRDVTTGLKPGDVSMTPWAQKIYDQRKTGDLEAQNPDANCLPQGVPKIDSTPEPFKILQEPKAVVFLYEAFGQYRQVFMDGRSLVKDPNPQWSGYATGRWDGDTLVIDSTGFNGKVWLDQLGHPATDALHTIERFRRRDFGHMDVTVIIEDPAAYAKPWTYTQPLTLLPETELLEDVCNENNRDVSHYKGK